ncbi:hypothetical protein [Butyrivibrio fibrisolvens]|uniref:hypothetical protein n=1 Tax=Butyrivibrio fibrisolvens TaxID=831 RepID=UPI0012BCFEC3|nr:hypothetical protein [Butyrivibrio fibrisolvens]
MDKFTIFYSIITSLIASVVFWVGSDLIPSKIKKLRIRPRIEEDIKSLLLYVFFYIQVPFLHSVHTASNYQSDINTKKLSSIDFENALYGKCLSKERCVNEFEHRLLPVGDKLKQNTKEIEKRLDKIFRYSDFISTKELLLLKEIDEKIHTYEYEEQRDIVDGMVIATVNPSISYMKSNFYELYLLYHDLKKACDGFWFVKRNDYDKYRIACQKLESRRYFSYWIKRFSLNSKLKMLLDVRASYIRGDRRRLEKKLRSYLDIEKQRLVAQRLFLEYLLTDDNYRNLLIEIRGYEEMQEYLDRVNCESMARKRFELRNVETKAIVADKEKRVPKISDMDEEELSKFRKLFDGYI